MERIRASLRRGPFRFRFTSLVDEDPADRLRLLPASLLSSLDPSRSAVPVIAYGPAALLRGAFLWGCADYLKDPWGPEELSLRSLLVLERGREGCLFPWGELTLDGCVVRTPFGRAELGLQEALLLRLLLSRRGCTVPREALRAVAAGRPLAQGSRLVDVRISSLRGKLAAVIPPEGAAGFLRCLRGQGYVIP